MNTYTPAHIRAYMTKLHFETGGDVISVIKRLGSVQFDPLDVVGRNPDLVMQSRVKNYRPEMLYTQIYDKRALVDGFDKMLCIFPTEDYPYLKRLRDANIWWFRSAPEIEAAADKVIDEIRARGPLCSSDLDMNDKVNWPWGPTRQSRATLESLWMSGRLILHHKQGARRYYDLAERHLPKHILEAPDPNTDEADYHAWQLLRRVSSVGLIKIAPSDAFLGIDNFKAEARAKAFGTLIGDGRLTRINIENKRSEYCVPTKYMPLLDAALDTPCKKTARIIAPLDNFIWDRRLIRELFGFHYHWEVYVPAEKREFGYYVLPIMYADNFIARFEPEHFRKGALNIKNFWWAEGVKPTKAMRAALDKCFARFCAYLGAEGVTGAMY